MFIHFCQGRKWFLAIVAGALGTFTAAQAGYAQGTWTALAPVAPTPTEGMTVGGVGQVIVGAYNDLPDSSHGHPFRRGRGDRCKRCPSALCVSCLCGGEGSQCPSYDSQKPFSSLAEMNEHIPFLLLKSFVCRKSRIATRS